AQDEDGHAPIPRRVLRRRPRDEGPPLATAGWIGGELAAWPHPELRLVELEKPPGGGTRKTGREAPADVEKGPTRQVHQRPRAYLQGRAVPAHEAHRRARCQRRYGARRRTHRGRLHARNDQQVARRTKDDARSPPRRAEHRTR